MLIANMASHHFFSQFDVHFSSDTLGHRSSCESPRLRANNHLGGFDIVKENELWYLGSLAEACLARHDNNLRNTTVRDCFYLGNTKALTYLVLMVHIEKSLSLRRDWKLPAKVQ